MAMEQGVWLAWGAGAFILSLVALGATQLPKVVAQAFSAVAIFSWWYWSLNATRVSVTTNCCVQYSSYDGAAIFGGLFGVVMLLFLLESTIGLFGLQESGGESHGIKGD